MRIFGSAEADLLVVLDGAVVKTLLPAAAPLALLEANFLYQAQCISPEGASLLNIKHNSSLLKKLHFLITSTIHLS